MNLASSCTDEKRDEVSASPWKLTFSLLIAQDLRYNLLNIGLVFRFCLAFASCNMSKKKKKKKSRPIATRHHCTTLQLQQCIT
jgi:hypothetical protein